MASTKREKELARQRAARQAASRAERERRKKRRTAVVASVVAVLLVAAAGAAATIATQDDTPGNDTLAADPTPDPAEQDEDPAEGESETEPAEQPDAAAEPVVVGECTYRPEGEPSRPVEPPSEQDLVTEGTRTATITTDQGPLTVELLAADAPCTVASFAGLARQDFYADTPCHRLTTQGIFVLQCGDPTGTGTGGAGYQLDEENLEGATYPRGTVAAAKRAAPGTSGSQFFLVYQDTQLPPEYTPFGRITAGLEVLDAVAAAGAEPPDASGNTAPVQPVQIESVEVG